MRRRRACLFAHAPGKGRVLWLAVAGLLAVSCGDDADDRAAPDRATTTAAPAVETSTTAPTTTAPPATLPPPSPGTCPNPPPYAAPAPDRPAYDVAASIDVPAGTVEGTVAVAFTPDLPTDILVLRLWPNGPAPSSTGTHTDILSTAVDGAAVTSTQPAPTVLELPAGRMLAPGDRMTATVGFRVVLGGPLDDRWSRNGESLRLGSFVPLLSWEPGVGWAREPPTSLFAEAVSSPVADWTLRLDVTPGYDVLASGRRDESGAWQAPAVRDVGVSVGRFDLASTTAPAPDPVEVTVGVDASVGDDPNAYLTRVTAALQDFAARFGPYPYDTYTLAITPGLGGGIEFPAHVMQGPGTAGRTTPHEVAHQWFYALVGNNQGRDPWLDEGLASWAEFRHDGTLADAVGRDIPAAGQGRLGEPMTYWEDHRSAYYRGVYVQGAAALASLGDADLVDCALRLYTAVNAHDVATSGDLVEALAVVFPDAGARLAVFGAG
ncbi:MAG: M1 family aminopeptidase [Acidimicrobiales bacterium]